MTPERRLAENLRRINPVSMWMTQGEVTATDGVTCSVRIGEAELEGIRLKASLSDTDRQILVVPKVGSAVVLGCITGDLNNMVVLQVDEIESITINGGKLGGLINIQQLTDKLNELVDKLNTHTHTIATGGIQVEGTAVKQANVAPITVPAITSKAPRFDTGDYEDDTITH